MPRYLNTGAGDPAQSLGAWLSENIVRGIKGLRAQFGYFSFGALEHFAPTIRACGEAGYPVHLVLGSNHGSLTQIDLIRTLRVIEDLSDASLTVVAYTNAEFHPKTVHIARADDSATALVGSGNLTDRGLGPK